MTVALFVIIPVFVFVDTFKKWSQTPRQRFAAVTNQCLALENVCVIYSVWVFSWNFSPSCPSGALWQYLSFLQMTIGLFVIIIVFVLQTLSKKLSQISRQRFAAVTNQCLALENVCAIYSAWVFSWNFSPSSHPGAFLKLKVYNIGTSTLTKIASR